MDPLSLVSRLAAAVHPPRFHSVRYGGILAAHAKWRHLVVPPPLPEAAPAPGAQDACHSLPMAKRPKPRPATHRCGHVPWQRLMRQLGIDVETLGPTRPAPAPRGFAAPVARCGGKMKVIALVRDPQGIARYLRHLGLPTEEPSMAVPSGPRACHTCPCPTRLRRARRLPADHPSGRAASCAAAMASRPARRGRRPPRRRHGGHPRPTAPLAVLRQRGTGLSREGKSLARGLGSRRNPALAGPPGTPSGPSVTRLLQRSSRPQGFHLTYGLGSALRGPMARLSVARSSSAHSSPVAVRSSIGRHHAAPRRSGLVRPHLDSVTVHRRVRWLLRSNLLASASECSRLHGSAHRCSHRPQGRCTR
jgi:hypothetical protein